MKQSNIERKKEDIEADIKTLDIKIEARGDIEKSSNDLIKNVESEISQLKMRKSQPVSLNQTTVSNLPQDNQIIMNLTNDEENKKKKKN